MKLIGSTLYQRILERAVRTARGEELAARSFAASRSATPPILPDGLHPGRNHAHQPLCPSRRASVSAAEVDALEDEISDRFGSLPEPVASLFAATRLSALASEAGVVKITTGPKATAFTVSPARAVHLRQRWPEEGNRRWVADRLVVDASTDHPHDETFIADVLTDLAA